MVDAADSKSVAREGVGVRVSPGAPSYSIMFFKSKALLQAVPILPLSSASTDSQLLKAGLYLVSTPLGNLKDITLRALEILKEADVILCEDTRHSRTLLIHYGITTPLQALHDYNETARIPSLLEKVTQGQRIALISDAGTPLISDPGFKLVQAFYETGHEVTALPGPVALINALVLSGLPCHQFYFGGFLPSKSPARLSVFETLTTLPATLIFYESPQRLLQTLKDIVQKFPTRELAVIREMTKKFEQVVRGSALTVQDHFRNQAPRGEIVLLIAPPQIEARWTVEMLTQAVYEGLLHHSLKQVALDLSLVSGWTKREIYQWALTLQTKATKS